MKPILFNTEMVKAILDGRKCCTRRNPLNFVMKDGYNPKWSGYSLGEYYTGHIETGVCLYSRGAHDVWGVRSNVVKPRYKVGDILYVRETWCDRWLPDGFLQGAERYGYKADGTPTFGYWGNDKQCKDNVWIPSIHMPKEAARIFLKVTDVRVERLQDITDIQAEGTEYFDCKKCSYNMWCNNLGHGETDCFKNIWDSTVKEYWQKWESNPYVWVIEFERCEKPEVTT